MLTTHQTTSTINQSLVFAGISVILINKKSEDGFSIIKSALPTLNIADLLGAYRALETQLFNHLLEQKEYDTLLTLSEWFINLFSSQLKEPDREITHTYTRELIAKLHTIRSQVYKRQNQIDLAKAEIAKNLELMRKQQTESQLKYKSITQQPDLKMIYIPHDQNLMLSAKVTQHINQAVEFKNEKRIPEAIAELEQAITANELLIKEPTVSLEKILRDKTYLKTTFIHSDIAKLYQEMAQYNKAIEHAQLALDRTLTKKQAHLTWYYQLQCGTFILKSATTDYLARGYDNLMAAISNPNYLYTQYDELFIQPLDAINMLEHTINTVNSINKTAWNKRDYPIIIKFTPLYIKLMESDQKYLPKNDYYNLFVAHNEMQHYPEALAAINEAIKLAVSDSNLLVNRATLHKTMGNINAACIDLNRSKKLATKLTYLHKKLTRELDELHKNAPADVKKTPAKKIKPAKPSSPIATQPEVEPAPARIAIKPPLIEAKPKQTLEEKKRLPKIENPLRAQKRELKKQKKELAEKNKRREQAVLQSRAIIQQLLERTAQVAEKKAADKIASETVKWRAVFTPIANEAATKAYHRLQHEKTVLQSRAIIQQLLEHTAQIAEKKTADKIKAETVKWQSAFTPVANEAATEAHHRQLRQSILTAGQFSMLCELDKKMAALGGAKLRIYGSSVFDYKLAEMNHPKKTIHPHDTDFQIRKLKAPHHEHAIKLIQESKFHYQAGGSDCDYIQFMAMIENKPMEATLVLDEKRYKEHFDPIDITRCGLIIKYRSSGRPYLDFDEHHYLLKIALKKGFFNVYLSGNLNNATFLFARMIKYSRMLSGILNMRIVNKHVYINMNATAWNHPHWKKWLNQYFEERFKQGTPGIKICYKEMNRLIKKSYLHEPEANNILYSFCLMYCRYHAIHLPSAVKNMLHLLRSFYRNDTVTPIDTACTAILSMFSYDAILFETRLDQRNLWERVNTLKQFIENPPEAVNTTGTMPYYTVPF